MSWAARELKIGLQMELEGTLDHRASQCWPKIVGFFKHSTPQLAHSP